MRYASVPVSKLLYALIPYLITLLADTYYIYAFAKEDILPGQGQYNQCYPLVKATRQSS